MQESETGTWFQSPEAYSLYASMPDLFRPFAIAVERVNELTNEGIKELTNEGVKELKGVCVGYVTKEKGAVRQFFTRRAIINGGPVFVNDASSEEAELLMKGVKELMSERINGGPIYIETRNFNDYSKWRSAFEAAGFEYKKHLNFHIDCTDREEMWKKLSETRRRQIRRVESGGIKELKNEGIKELKNEGVKELKSEGIKELKNEGVNELEIKEWYEILQRLYKTKVKRPLFPLSFFLQFYRQGLGTYLLVKDKGKVIGGVMCPIDEGRCIYEWYICGMDAEYKEQCPSVMATWDAMDYAEKNGIARFDVMGAGAPDVPYGVRDFKAEFGGRLVEHGRFIHVVRPWLYQIGVLGVKLLKRYQ